MSQRTRCCRIGSAFASEFASHVDGSNSSSSAPSQEHLPALLRRLADLAATLQAESRRVLFMAAMVARRHNPRLNAFADRLAAAGKSKMSVRFAVLHKLFKISFTLLKNQSLCLPTHTTSQN